MGKLTITENVGEGLYKGKIEYQTSGIQAELDRLQAQNLSYWRDLLNALNHRDLLRGDVAMYKETLDALIKQWKDLVLSKTKVPPPIVPESADEDENNPETGLPYTDEERATALEEEVLSKINTARVAAGLAPFTRSSTLDTQVRNRLKDWQGVPIEDLPDLSSDAYLQMLLRQKSIQDEGRTVRENLLANAPGVIAGNIIEAVANGQTSSADVVAALQRDSATWAQLMSADATEAGVNYRYNPGFPGTYSWGVSALTPGTVPASNPDFFAAPAGQALVAAMDSALGPLVANGLQQGPDGGSGGGGSGSGDWNAAWSPNTYYGAGTTVKGRVSDGREYLCRSVMSGLSGDKEPLWPGPGGSIGDNTLIWTVLAKIPDPTAALINSWYGYSY